VVSVLLIRISSRGVRHLDQVGVPVGVITQERAPGRDQPRIPVLVLRDVIARHQDGETPTQTLVQVRLDQGSDRCELGFHDFYLPV
jgi:hypothetical protein